MSLMDKTALVTAGAEGIGRAIAETLVREGAKVHVCDVNAEAIADINRADSDLKGTSGDVTKPADVDRVFKETLARFGDHLDILVNNAGIAGPTGPVESLDPNGWRATFDVNLHGAFHCLQQAVPLMKAQKSGSIVNLSSSAGLFGFPLRTPYAAAKWGVIGLTKSLAMELGPFGIRVNALCPGSVKGPRIDRVIAADAKSRGVKEQEIYDAYVKQVSMRSFVEAQDIAEMVAFICSPRGAMISGQALSVDGHTETLGAIDL